ncbi:hypothetical protein [Homoserinibacter sp. YIM 151385]|uniref:ApeA N-terminal domain 1-containing protein n=1 Tax=Homoserinibacter sp. YIM 151385 TaxID=2985506 RepID=UPI0022F09B82|nr:hypothetical protein [Homoserinibacter sp. YIM 151385]WBU36702.1 hypothetical protein OF852_07060 [Homoserinibacter sp. YIM 151385]
MANTLDPGDIRVGQLFDGVDNDEPLQSATLTFQPGLGATVLVPYVTGETEFRTADDWFRNQAPPTTLLFVDNKGAVLLSGVRWAGHSGAQFLTGKLRANATVLGRPRRIKEDYRVREMSSAIDGLAEFAGFSPVQTNLDAFPADPLVIRLSDEEQVRWRSNGFSYSIRSRTPWSAIDGQEFTVRSAPQVVTSSSRLANVDAHLTAQWPIRALLSMVMGERIAWRSHHIRDDQFPTWMAAGPPRAAGPVEVRLRRTLRDQASEAVDHADLALPWLRLTQLGAAGMRRWTRLYSDPLLRRGIEPIVEVINGASKFLEPQLMMTAIALDYIDYYRDRRRRTLAQRITACMVAADLEWPEVGTRVGIGKAIAKLNNDLKHPDRETQPEAAVLHCLTDLAILVARAQLIQLLEMPRSAREEFRRSRAANHVKQMLTANGIRVQEDGRASSS